MKKLNKKSQDELDPKDALKFEAFKEKNKDILLLWMKRFPKKDPPIMRDPKSGDFIFNWPNRATRRALGIM